MARKKYNTVQVCLGETDKEKVQVLANEEGISTSAYIRKLVLKDLKEKGEKI